MNLSGHSAATGGHNTAPRPLVIGATGMVGGLILRRLAEAGELPIGVSRHPQAAAPGIEWLTADLADPAGLALPSLETVYATSPAALVADAIPALAAHGMTRLVVFTSTSLETKQNSDDPDEREMIRRWAEAERRIIEQCAARGIAWTVLRPTLIYAEGRDANVSRIAALIRRFRFFPLAGGGEGLRQPVHADDLAQAAIAAASRPNCFNKTYNLPGGETLSYREMVGRIFDGLGLRRMIIPLPGFVWAVVVPVVAKVVPGISGAIVGRMAKDMTFDLTPAATEIGWQPRPFRPNFRR
ncbi:SDR family oxidoreductase [Rhodopseudomonas palustris]|uniref:NAD-dependent epimerase/dehydratase n=1 Tax=Rhodopseudomonas palustris (strain BisB18) TaxID=316056 RepID=Q20YW2_RHOPB